MNNLPKSLTWLLGVVFLVIGVAGFFTDGMLLWFEVDAIHNSVHLLTGAAAIALASIGKERLFLIVFGAIYALVTVLGFMSGSALGLFPVNAADNYLHLVIAIVALGAAFGLKEKGEITKIKVEGGAPMPEKSAEPEAPAEPATPATCPKCGGEMTEGHVCPAPKAPAPEQPAPEPEKSSEPEKPAEPGPAPEPEAPAEPAKCPKCGGEMTEGHTCPAPEQPAEEKPAEEAPAAETEAPAEDGEENKSEEDEGEANNEGEEEKSEEEKPAA